MKLIDDLTWVARLSMDIIIKFPANEININETEDEDWGDLGRR